WQFAVYGLKFSSEAVLGATSVRSPRAITLKTQGYERVNEEGIIAWNSEKCTVRLAVLLWQGRSACPASPLLVVMSRPRRMAFSMLSAWAGRWVSPQRLSRWATTGSGSG